MRTRRIYRPTRAGRGLAFVQAVGGRHEKGPSSHPKENGPACGSSFRRAQDVLRIPARCASVEWRSWCGVRSRSARASSAPAGWCWPSFGPSRDVYSCVACPDLNREWGLIYPHADLGVSLLMGLIQVDGVHIWFFRYYCAIKTHSTGWLPCRATCNSNQFLIESGCEFV